MKEIFAKRIIPLFLILAALGVTYYFYQQGEISFLPQQGTRKGIDEGFSAQFPMRDKEVKLSYKDKPSFAFDIANFEDNENWYGDGDFDYSTFFEGNSSLFITSLEGQKATVSLNKNFNINDVLNFKFIIYLATDPANIEDLNLIFTGEDSTYKFPIRDLSKGWNLLFLPKEKFSISPLVGSKEITAEIGEETLSSEGIQKVIIELNSRPKARSTVNLDSLWAEKEEDYLEDWNADNEKFLSIKSFQEEGKLLAIGLNGSRATLKKGSAKNYSLQAEFTPLSKGKFGFFLRGDCQSGYGYYLMVDGVETDGWQIYKYGLFEDKNQSIDLKRGTISNFKMEKEKPYWLKVELKGSRLIFSFSVDGKNFSVLGEANDGSYTNGGVGIAVSGSNMVLIDEIWFSQ